MLTSSDKVGVAPPPSIVELVATWPMEPAQHFRDQRRRSLPMDHAQAPRVLPARARHSGIAAHPTATAVRVRCTAVRAAIQLSVHARMADSPRPLVSRPLSRPPHVQLLLLPLPLLPRSRYRRMLAAATLPVLRVASVVWAPSSETAVPNILTGMDSV